MMHEKTLNSVSQIFALLKQEKEALIGGDIDALHEVTELKQAWIDDLPERPLPLNLEQIREIKYLSDQNAALSESCQLAQKSVLDRLSEITKIQRTMGTYTMDGTFFDAKDPPPKVETRS